MPYNDTPDNLGPDEATIEYVAPSSTPSRDTPSHDTTPYACVDLVVGARCHLSDEMRQTLRSRLRISALVLCAGFGSFLVWSLITVLIGSGYNRWAIVHLSVVTAVLGMCGGLLCRHCQPDARALHIHELIIFGMPVAFFIHIQTRQMITLASQDLPLDNPAASWLLIIFVHALFIPNTWRRAAAFLGPIAAAPVLTALVLAWVNGDVAMALSADPLYLVELALEMAIGYGSCIAGVYTIGTLRREAFTARQLGQYRLQERLGAGGMGEVFLAEHQLLKRPCAIKVIRPEKAGDAKVLKRFEREVHSTAKLSHWNSVAVYDYGHTRDGTFYYVMEYLPGLNLNDVVERYGPLPAGRVIHILRQACDALREAHGQGIIHRDIKPANLFLAERGGVQDVVKVLDYGLAKPLGGPPASGLTQEGAIAGSPYFMSPEQAMGEPDLDARSDIYSLGVVAYFLLTGQPPFDDPKPMKVLLGHAHQAPVRPSEHNSHIPADMEQLVMRCLAKKPEDRYQTAEELATALGRCASAGSWQRDDAADWWRDHEAASCARAESFST